MSISDGQILPLWLLPISHGFFSYDFHSFAVRSGMFIPSKVLGPWPRGTYGEPLNGSLPAFSLSMNAQT